MGRYRPPDNRSGPAGPARHSGEGGGGPGARGGTSPYPTVPAAYLPSNATGSVRSSPGSESMAAPTRRPSSGFFVRGFGGFAGIQTAAIASAIFASTEAKPLKPPRESVRGGHNGN